MTLDGIVVILIWWVALITILLVFWMAVPKHDDHYDK